VSRIRATQRIQEDTKGHGYFRNHWTQRRRQDNHRGVHLWSARSRFGVNQHLRAFSAERQKRDREFVGVQLQEAALPPPLRVGEAVKLFASFYPTPSIQTSCSSHWASNRWLPPGTSLEHGEGSRGGIRHPLHRSRRPRGQGHSGRVALKRVARIVTGGRLHSKTLRRDRLRDLGYPRWRHAGRGCGGRPAAAALTLRM